MTIRRPTTSHETFFGLVLPVVLALGWLAGASQPARAQLGQPLYPEYRIADPGAAEVTLENLYERDRFWPFRVRLTQDWKPSEGGQTLQARRPGVLIRVLDPKLARVDFGRKGVHHVPIEKTDLVERANELRLGKAEKSSPNFVHVFDNRLLDASREVLVPFVTRRTDRFDAYLAVHADPAAEGFEALARDLRPLHESGRVLTVLFPQGGHIDENVFFALKEADWPITFMFRFLAGPFSRSELPPWLSPPAYMLLTAEGKVLLEGNWKKGAGKKLVAAMEERFPAKPNEVTSAPGSGAAPTP